MIEPAVPHQVPSGARCSILIIPGTEDEPRNSRHHDRARAHRAGLERDDERAPFESPLTEHLSCRSQHEDLGVSRRVASPLTLIAGGRDHRAIGIEDDGTDRYIASSPRLRRLSERQPHGAGI